MILASSFNDYEEDLISWGCVDRLLNLLNNSLVNDKEYILLKAEIELRPNMDRYEELYHYLSERQLSPLQTGKYNQTDIKRHIRNTI